MKNSLFLITSLIASSLAFCQNTTDYTQLSNWHFHPNKTINPINGYNLDIAVIDKNQNVDSVISIQNNSVINTGVDVFFVHPTVLTSIPSSPDTVAISNQPSFLISSTIIAQGALLSKYGRFYAPKYRQASPSSFNDSTFSDSLRAKYLAITYSDIKNSFLDYLNNHNNGNKIILAGHSQGSYLLGMLLRDLFDSDPILQSKLVTASLGGMGFVYATPSQYSGGWWENIPLCTLANQCGCVHNWTSFKESQSIPAPNVALPAFNQNMVDSGLVHRTIDLNSDWFIQDSLFYSSQSSPLRYYITPDANYNLGNGANFIAFDSLYTARLKRTNNTKVVLAVDYINDPMDFRPNDLLSQESHPNYSNWGFHQKDYNIYLWALMNQIDQKLVQCSQTSSISETTSRKNDFSVYPNPSSGLVKVKFSDKSKDEESIEVYDSMGKRLLCLEGTNMISFVLKEKGLFFVKTRYGVKKVLIE